MSTTYHIVDTEITKSSVNDKVLEAFCYGIFKGKHRTLFTTGSSGASQYLSFAFTEGEDALFFTMKKVELDLLKIMDPVAAKRIELKSKRKKKAFA